MADKSLCGRIVGAGTPRADICDLDYGHDKQLGHPQGSLHKGSRHGILWETYIDKDTGRKGHTIVDQGAPREGQTEIFKQLPAGASEEDLLKIARGEVAA